MELCAGSWHWLVGWQRRSVGAGWDIAVDGGTSRRRGHAYAYIHVYICRLVRVLVVLHVASTMHIHVLQEITSNTVHYI